MLLESIRPGLADHTKGVAGAGIILRTQPGNLQNEFPGDPVVENETALSLEVISGFAYVTTGNVGIIHITRAQDHNGQQQHSFFHGFTCKEALAMEGKWGITWQCIRTQ